MSTFSDQLILAQWVFQQLGVDSFAPLQRLLHAPELEGWAEDGATYFVEQLISKLPREGSRSISNEMLREYDENIVRHWKHITTIRNTQGSTVHLLYFQYVALLLAEIYLDQYFHNRQGLLDSLNQFLSSASSTVPARLATKARGRKKSAIHEIQPFSEDDLNKVAFWMATGSGKTLLMHCNIRQYLHYAGKAGVRHNLNRIILLTPNEGLSRQHLEEFELSGIAANLFGNETQMRLGGRTVDIIDVHKLRETTREKTVAVDTFEGNNLVLVDEGHRGAGGEEWMEKRARLCEQGFSFEYSATFGQAIKATTGAKQRELVQTYAKTILFDYSYKFFYDDGYGKDFNILNLAEEHEEETRPLYLTACLLAFYQQCRRFADGGAALLPYLLESPLMIFVGGSVTGQRQTQEDTDLVLILKFLAEFIGNRTESVRRLDKLLRRQARLLSAGEDVFAEFFPFVESIWKPPQASDLFQDILRQVFNAPSGGQLHIVRLQGSDGEIGLRVGEHPWFGVVNVGDAKKLCDLCAEKRGEADRYVVDDMVFSGSLFAEIKQPGSQIRLLAGAKKFTEGWSSWRVSAMGLMNVGKKEGSEIIQLFGRGVRLKGYRFKLKRTAALDALDFQADDVRAHPDRIALLETLNIFGIKSDYMKEFQEYLTNEGIGEDDRRELVLLPTIKLPEFAQETVHLNIIRPKAEMPEFKKQVRLQIETLEGRLTGKVSADWYPRLQKHSSPRIQAGPSGHIHYDTIRRDHIAFLTWESIWFELEHYKRDKAYYNIVLSQESLRTLMAQSWWYDLMIPPGYLDFRFDRIALWQDISIQLLKGYLDRFYSFHKREFEAPYLEYQVLRPTDELVLNEYQLLVKKSEKQLIQRLRALSEKFRAGDFEAFSFANLEVFQASRHLYQPLIHLTHGAGQDSLIKIVPTHLNEGEKRFVDDLEAACKAEAMGILSETELYLLRNHNSDKAISFFSESGFRPDFILWLLKDDRQTIAFIDPKGFRNFTDAFNNPKIQLARRIKDLQLSLKRSEIRLESFLINQSHLNDLRWPSPANSKRDASPAEYRAHHILCAKDEPDTYMRDLLVRLATENSNSK